MFPPFKKDFFKIYYNKIQITNILQLKVPVDTFMPQSMWKFWLGKNWYQQYVQMMNQYKDDCCIKLQWTVYRYTPFTMLFFYPITVVKDFALILNLQ